MPQPAAEELIARLQLSRHPEGGWFRETYRSTETIPAEGLPGRFGGQRPFGTAIYFLLERGDFSALHRIKSDETWHFYAGAPLAVQAVTPEGLQLELKLGAGLAAGETFQATVPAGCWFGAELAGDGEFALVGCTVAPGFDFQDFEMADRQQLSAMFPAHRELIGRLTR
ncbi:MAG TPA: cupin domain-containing protein [Geomonas sp.]|nr:cupin domain-containing protein [Geomonas sp.]